MFTALDQFGLLKCFVKWFNLSVLCFCLSVYLVFVCLHKMIEHNAIIKTVLIEWKTICLNDFLSIHLHIRLSLYNISLSLCLSLSLFIFLYLSLSLSLSLWNIKLFDCLSIWISLCLYGISLSLSLSLFISNCSTVDLSKMHFDFSIFIIHCIVLLVCLIVSVCLCLWLFIFFMFSCISFKTHFYLSYLHSSVCLSDCQFCNPSKQK